MPAGGPSTILHGPSACDIIPSEPLGAQLSSVQGELLGQAMIQLNVQTGVVDVLDLAHARGAPLTTSWRVEAPTQCVPFPCILLPHNVC